MEEFWGNGRMAVLVLEGFSTTMTSDHALIKCEWHREYWSNIHTDGCMF
jgi:hypothetical protein